LVIQVERAQKVLQGLNLISSKNSVNMIMYVQIDCLEFRSCWMYTPPSHSLSLCADPLSQASQLHVIVPAMVTRINEPHSSVLPGPSQLYSGKSVKAANKPGHYVKVGTGLLYPTSCWVQWLIKRPISHPCLTTTY
jgi:hypothetical protein